VLIELGPLAILTDPLLRGRVAHLRRHVAAAAMPERIDAVLLSHVHRDHADGPSLRSLPAEVPVIVPADAGRAVRALRARRVIELQPGDKTAIGDATVTAVEAEHHVRRDPLRRRTDALGFIVERGRRVYFAGDTSVFDGMAAWRPLDVALLPIWGWGPSLGPGHMGPAEAARATALLSPRLVVPIHWATYLPLGYRRGHTLLSDPAREYTSRATELAPETRVALLAPGEAVEL
jgi:L-ascorbate metabolism protein UlaG (beta-lactamase superfamily)